MSCTQKNIFANTAKLSKPCSLPRASFVQIPDFSKDPIHLPKYYKMAKNFPSYFGHCTPIHSFGKTRNSRGGNEAFSLDSLKGALKGLRQEKTVQNMLKSWTHQHEFGGGGNGKGNPPRNSGGGGSHGTGDDGTVDEIFQVVMATLAFILVYIYMIRGAELTKLAKDYIKYRLGGPPSSRLKSIMDKWKSMCAEIPWVGNTDKLLLRKITPTWWHWPDEIARHLGSNDGGQRAKVKHH